ncbi:sugar phosphate isomerase/epimerase family protein [Sphingobium boeckii]|uniref:Sugar phosphate isomerase/epimerase n=1 Tax=Sphingobium boeckii TaxID=1082345 RepID=A0A7W9AH48_9SPHN|nr:sugar phosphate isomerase/epimerase [Sphingobium boeckii]MBB5685359.1 sugar phosphate isomerase/epimerase [Sphingobium boeckii]
MRDLSRRLAITGGLAALIGGAPSLRAAKPFFAQGTMPLGLNLYVLAAMFRQDPGQTLRAVADIGYREVEATLETHSAETLRPLLANAGLRCASLNILPRPLRGGVSLLTDSHIIAAGARLMQAAYVTLTLFPFPEGGTARIAEGLSVDGWHRTADQLNAKGREFKRHGLRFAYHNHNVELAPRGETNGLAILLENTDPALVHFHMDAGWVVAAGHDPVTFLKAYPGRFRLMHVKDIRASHQVNTALKADTTEIGSGIIDWRRVLDAARRAGVRHFAVEQEPPYAGAPIDSARKSFMYLSNLSR